MPLTSSTTSDDQIKFLEESLQVVKVQGFQLKKCLDNNKLMDALKHCSSMLAELRTSALSPKHYYELYISITDALRPLYTFLKEAHLSERHHLADLYELVQYAGNIVPRLYLMITVGSVFMGVPEAPVSEVMKDMLEMTRGVQHPTRGLFLRHYLSQMTKDNLPVGEGSEISGDLKDSVDFILTNFIEMNKLWVRLQHQGHSKDREKRELERKDLRTLIGSNLVRLSQLDGVTLEMYQETILPTLLEQIVSCKDVIAQEYLMEAIVQVFQDDFHLRTLAPFLSATKNLNLKVSVKQIIISLIDRIASYAERESENESDEVKTKQGIPEDIQLFDVFWEEIVDLIQSRPDISIQDLTSLLLSLTNLSLNCYPGDHQFIDKIYEFVIKKLQENENTPDSHANVTIRNIEAMLTSPINSYNDPLTILQLEFYSKLLSLQPSHTKKTIGRRLISKLSSSGIYLDNEDKINGFVTLIQYLFRVSVENKKSLGPVWLGFGLGFGAANLSPEDEELEGDLRLVSKIAHSIYHEDIDTQLELLTLIKNKFQESGELIQYLFTPVAFQLISLGQRSYLTEPKNDVWKVRMEKLLRLLYQFLSEVYLKCQQISDLILRLYLNCVQLSDLGGFEEMSYEYFVETFTIYEEGISESKSQFQALSLIISTLQTCRNLSTENYDTLSRKCVLHSSKMLKRPDQTRALILSSHLFWPIEIADRHKENTLSGIETLQDSKKVLDCLLKGLRFANSCLDSVVSVELLIEILCRYVYYFDLKCDSIGAHDINSLIESVQTMISNTDAFDEKKANSQTPHAISSSSIVVPEGSLAKYVTNYLKVLLLYLDYKKEFYINQKQSFQSTSPSSSNPTVDNLPNYYLINTNVLS